MITRDEILKLLRQPFPQAEIEVYDLTGTLDHYKVVIVSDQFESLNLVKRHQMVNAALAEPLKGPLHALTIDALTVTEAKAKLGDGNQPKGIEF